MPEKKHPQNSAEISDLLLKFFPLLGLLGGVLMWLVDAAIDVTVIHPDETFWESVFAGDDTELWMRTVVVFVMTGSAFFAQHLLRKEKSIEAELRLHKQNLEYLVAERTHELEQLASIDPLTKIYNRRKFNEILAYEIQQNFRYNKTLSLVMCDIDYFKNINDQHGHDIGDAVLVSFADCLKKNLRQTDIYARWGGEEFIILLPHTAINEASIVANKLCKLIPECSEKQNTVMVTASFGVAQLSTDEDASALITRADKALYQAKDEGRSRVCVL